MDRLFGLDRAVPAEDGLSLLTTLYDDVLLGIYEELLKEENIPYLKKDRGAGGAVRIMMGSSLYGTDIYVPDTYLERATELITPADGAKISEKTSDEEQ